MKKQQQQSLERELERTATAVVKATLDWSQSHAERTFEDIEVFVLEIRKRMGQDIAQALCEEQETARPVPGPECPKCGQEMHYKGEHERQIGSLVSDVKFKRSYYHCNHCKDSGIFPPG